MAVILANVILNKDNLKQYFKKPPKHIFFRELVIYSIKGVTKKEKGMEFRN